jgi:hypothetical protein
MHKRSRFHLKPLLVGAFFTAANAASKASDTCRLLAGSGRVWSYTPPPLIEPTTCVDVGLLIREIDAGMRFALGSRLGRASGIAVRIW